MLMKPVNKNKQDNNQNDNLLIIKQDGKSPLSGALFIAILFCMLLALMLYLMFS